MQVSINADGALETAQRLSDLPGKVLVAQRRALGTLRRRWPVLARRDIQTEYALSATRIRDGLSVRITRDGIALVGRVRGIGLLNFAGRGTPSGLRYRIFRNRPGHEPHGFVRARRGQGIDKAWEREPLIGSGGHRRVPRYPIEPLFGPSLAQMLRKGDRPARMAQAGLDVITADLDRQLLRSLRR
ncbi:hypothetical protein [Lysobacter antibioticus]|uniref:hypothetical protein n=1 Tax=Lysobacter antibioticus TaxID=84531 RepID=UPI0003488B70|nr:hypothetical protein [Lysobacter antibioticus]